MGGRGIPEVPLPARAGRLGLILLPAAVVAVGGWIHRWTADDAFVYFRVADNVLHGRGPVFNPGERVEAYTSPLWAAVVTVADTWDALVPVEWSAVILGLVCAVAGFLLAATGAERLADRGPGEAVLPAGLLALAACAGLWDFATSGLETGLVFLWEGMCFDALASLATSPGRRRPTTVAVLIGLGPLVRPELTLASAGLLVGLVTLVRTQADRAEERGGRRARSWRLVAAALGAPVAYELFRMAYFASLVANPALAKSAGSSRVGEGFTYLGDTVGTYVLWVPVVVLGPFLVHRLAGLDGRQHRPEQIVTRSALGAGLAGLAYVVWVGGDYMHARLLLPGLFLLAAPAWLTLRRRDVPALVATLALAGWVVAVAGFVRVHDGWKGTIVDYRAGMASLARRTAAVTLEDYTHGSLVLASGVYSPADVGAALRAMAGEPGSQMVVLSYPATVPLAPVGGASSSLPERVFVPAVNIGLLGYAAGDRVYVYDEFSLVDPIGARTVVTRRGQPGHEKRIDASWLVARVAPYSDLAALTAVEPPAAAAFPPGRNEVPTSAQVRSAVSALRCGGLHSYLVSITAPLTIGRMLSNLWGAWGDTFLSYSADPTIAVEQVCPAGPKRGGVLPAASATGG